MKSFYIMLPFDLMFDLFTELIQFHLLFLNFKYVFSVVRKCIYLPEDEIEEWKQAEWKREVELLTSNEFRQINIVRGIKVKPDTFLIDLMKTNPTGMPILITEYCDGDDLQTQLFENSNASGMKECEVRNILQSLKNAVSYLHARSIIHRNIQPKNIVFQVDGNNQRVYKVRK